MSPEFSGGARHWRRETDSAGICRLILDRQGTSANSLSSAVLEQLNEQLAEISSSERITALIIESGKETSFVLGADIEEFAGIDSAETGSRAAARGQEIFAKIEALPIPTVAAINGYALGGGLELALACDYRVAVESYERSLGLPEVQLGIHPGFGGTVRAVRLLGAPTALDLMMTGRRQSPIEALRSGLVDRLATDEPLIDACMKIAHERPARKRAGLGLRLLNLKPLRRFVARRVRAKLERKVRREHYPAPFAIVDLWERHGGRGESAYRAEAASIGRLFVTDTARNLVRVYWLRERLKHLAGEPAEMSRVHVVGAGVMGGDIAAWCALKALSVSLRDPAEGAVGAAQARAARLFERRLKAPGAAGRAAERLTSDEDGSAAGTADVVIEAIVERLDVKQQVFGELERLARPNTVLATNTSSLRIEDIAAGLGNPTRLVGLHFFNPVAQMPLVEVISGEQTDPAVLARAMAFVVQIGKLPLPCKSAPGFVVNRILTPYLVESLRALEDGHQPEEIDAAAVAFGMPVGPIELADQVGLDVALHVAQVLQDVVRGELPETLSKMVDAGELGQKTGKGFYRYDGRKPRKKIYDGVIDSELQDRLLLPLVNEAVACVDEGVVEDADLLDAGAVFGTGFAPFRGGPLRYAEQRGIDDIVGSLESLTARYGDRFQPHAGWSRFPVKRD